MPSPLIPSEDVPVESSFLPGSSLGGVQTQHNSRADPAQPRRFLAPRISELVGFPDSFIMPTGHT